MGVPPPCFFGERLPPPFGWFQLRGSQQKDMQFVCLGVGCPNFGTHKDGCFLKVLHIGELPCCYGVQMTSFQRVSVFFLDTPYLHQTVDKQEADISQRLRDDGMMNGKGQPAQSQQVKQVTDVS